MSAATAPPAALSTATRPDAEILGESSTGSDVASRSVEYSERKKGQPGVRSQLAQRTTPIKETWHA